jgi:hypothetical protein
MAAGSCGRGGYHLMMGVKERGKGRRRGERGREKEREKDSEKSTLYLVVERFMV